MKTILALLIMLALFSAVDSALAWQPDGWVWHSWPYQYSLEEAGWFYLQESQNMWGLNLDSVQWFQLREIDPSWVYFAWPYVYVLNEDSWSWLDQNDVLWCLELTSLHWSRYGQPSAPGPVSAPTFLPDGGVHPIGIVSTLVSCATAGATIRYTIDGSEPTESSPVVASGGVVAVPAPGRLSAKAWKSGSSPSDVKLAYYAGRGDVAPPDMVLIPGGSFQMGDGFSEGEDDERPVHTVFLNPLYMGRAEVTKALWDEVYDWAATNGYSFDNPGQAKGGNHPVHTVNWFDAVKWCNARSEREGRLPAYYTSESWGTVYRTGSVNLQRAWVRWDTGYRLPTEAEWERAARGGVSGQRFPGSNTISHASANFQNSGIEAYATGGTGYHPGHSTGSMPYTSPAGSFPPNGYGLYDMAGNVWEWCWDRYHSGYYALSPGANPRGTDESPDRCLRGGSWTTPAFYCRTAFRSSEDQSPYDALYSVGFRVVLPTAPGHMVLIPSGSFEMGDAFDEGEADERPVHSVHVSAFYMDQTEVTKAQWDAVYAWAVANGYSFDHAGQGKAPDHPVQKVSWYDCVKWCNARSEMEGRIPAYYTSAGFASADVYRTDQVDVQNDWVWWENAGYRLPTEAEWEKAARGQAEGRRFPWHDSDTIQHARANYYSSSIFTYDTSPTRECHPTYNDGVEPYTGPAGSFAANGYGLHDMMGNVMEWCWDWYHATWYSWSSGVNPRGPTIDSTRVIRDVAWTGYSERGRVAHRAKSWMGAAHANTDELGFRTVLPVSE